MRLPNSPAWTTRASTLQLAPSSRSFSSSPSQAVWVQKRIKVQLRADHPLYGKAGKVICVRPGHMRQRLYPSGNALYCANDGIPIHHFQPSAPQRSKVPAPGLSRSLVDLLKRLGIQMQITRPELRAAQAQINGWKQLANPTSPQPEVPSPAPPKTRPSSQSTPFPAPKGLAQHLQQLSQSLESAQKPLLVIKRPGPENSDTLYSAIKADEIIASLVEQLEFTPAQPLEAPLSGFLKIAGCSDPRQELPQAPNDHHSNFRFKPIKTTGNYLLSIALSPSHHHHPCAQRSSKENDEQTYMFSVVVEK